jgi:D-psicose/D-tagatose/L-ribulose 3-epimerase
MTLADTRPLLGVNTFVWRSPLDDAGLQELAPTIADWGFGAIELPLESIGDFDPTESGELLRSHHLAPVVCAVMPPGRNLVAPRGDELATTTDYLLRCIDAAVDLGAKAVVGPMYAAVGRTWRLQPDERRTMIRDLREALRPIAAHAGERGITLGIEPLNRYETSVFNTTEQLLDLIDGLPSESVGLNLDAYHMNIEEKDPPAAIRSAGDRLVHYQVSGNDRGTPGEDHIGWVAIRDALKAVDYRGVIGIESFTADNKTIATAASIWRPLARSQDLLATDGLRFLQDWLQDW